MFGILKRRSDLKRRSSHWQQRSCWSGDFLIGNLLAHTVGVSCTLLDPPTCHILQYQFLLDCWPNIYILVCTRGYPSSEWSGAELSEQSQVVLRQPSRTVLLNSYFEQCLRTEISNKALYAENRALCALHRPLHLPNRGRGVTEQCLCAQSPSPIGAHQIGPRAHRTESHAHQAGTCSR